jgi:hypothetical protein
MRRRALPGIMPGSSRYSEELEFVFGACDSVLEVLVLASGVGAGLWLSGAVSVLDAEAEGDDELLALGELVPVP